MSSDSALGQQHAGPSAPWPAGLLAGLKLCLLGSLILAAAVLMERRLGGDMAAPLGAGWLAAVAAAAVLVAHLARRCDSFRSATEPNSAAPPITATSWSSTCACIVLAGALSLPGSSPAGLAALWGIVLVGEGGWWLSRLRLPHSPADRDIAEAPWIVQQARRDRHGDGRERVVGWMRVDLPAGQRVAQAHVAFCPPLEQTPAIELRQTSGPAARLKLGQALAYGARFELKLPEPGPASIVLEYTATTSAAAPTAS
ncbi:MAG TPA: hypothetical protein VG433_01000 [Pirellulales bacterium]|nr:hypothetical protein [Pirellulales bacterium]